MLTDSPWPAGDGRAARDETNCRCRPKCREELDCFGLTNVIVLLAYLLVFSTAVAAGCELTILVRGVGSDAGIVRIALFDTKDSYVRSDARKKPGKQGEVFKKGATEIQGTSITWTPGEIPCGRYAAAAYHDVNANGRLDSNFFGKPKEKYGFSNGQRRKFGKPKFEQIAFEVKGLEEITITIE